MASKGFSFVCLSLSDATGDFATVAPVLLSIQQTARLRNPKWKWSDSSTLSRIYDCDDLSTTGACRVGFRISPVIDHLDELGFISELVRLFMHKILLEVYDMCKYAMYDNDSDSDMCKYAMYDNDSDSGNDFDILLEFSSHGKEIKKNLDKQCDGYVDSIQFDGSASFSRTAQQSPAWANIIVPQSVV
ncbi:hypothetical protein PHJA_000626900 [Phtheirospermum japonicum]|uniref:Uncharacterized protein n=1 Tax=Phtheirospermum japonicum TaxID=374723 RepID=A0A830BS61_9LAMI|nr:hypothetical protein PHJA_000626900 [Phtheirospermum japonicum]